MMEIEIERKTNWSDVRDAARATMWRLPDGKEPTSEWKRKILLARHSPIEALIFKVTMKDIPYWVSVHLVRHKVGITHWVSSQRDDRHENEVPRAEMPQGALVTHTMQINAQALIAVSRKRLCCQASTETRQVWAAVKKTMESLDPDMAWAMRPECDWCGGHCPEMKGCGARPPLMEVFR